MPCIRTVTISDNGKGIPGAELNRVFESNFRDTNVGEVKGIGLPLCLSIMERHNGTLRDCPSLFGWETWNWQVIGDGNQISQSQIPNFPSKLNG